MVLLIDHVNVSTQELFCQLHSIYISQKNIEIHLNSGKTTCKSETDSFFSLILLLTLAFHPRGT